MSGKREMIVQWNKNFQTSVNCRGLSITVDQPKEDGGDNAGLSPTELLVASLGSCIVYYAVVFLERRKVPATGLKVILDWEYAENPRRIGKINASISLDAELDEKQKKGLLKIAQSCTVHNTLTHAPQINVNMQ